MTSLDDFITQVEDTRLKLYSPHQVSYAGPNKWKCIYCGFSDNVKINANWIKDRLFKCPNCGEVLEGLGRIWWKVREVEG